MIWEPKPNAARSAEAPNSPTPRSDEEKRRYRHPMLITVEGGDGAGKTTLVRALAQHWSDAGLAVRTTLEPGGTELGRGLRELVLHTEGELGEWAETFLFLADRSADVAQIIRPALNRGELVLCDRYADSTLAYQGYGRGLDLPLLRRLNDAATDGLRPRLTILLDIPAEQGIARARADGGDRIADAALEFHRRVNHGFRQIAAAEPDRVVLLDAAQPPDMVLQQAIVAAEPRLHANLLLPLE